MVSKFPFSNWGSTSLFPKKYGWTDWLRSTDWSTNQPVDRYSLITGWITRYLHMSIPYSMYFDVYSVFQDFFTQPIYSFPWLLFSIMYQKLVFLPRPNKNVLIIYQKNRLLYIDNNIWNLEHELFSLNLLTFLLIFVSLPLLYSCWTLFQAQVRAFKHCGS